MHGKREDARMVVPKEKPMVFLVTDEYNELKSKVHDRLVDMLDLSLIDSLDRSRVSIISGVTVNASSTRSGEGSTLRPERCL